MDKTIQNFFTNSFLSLLRDKEIRREISQIHNEGAIELLEELKRRDTENKHITIAEAAEHYGKSKPTIHSWINKSGGIIKKYRPNKNSNAVFVKISEIEKSFLATGKFKIPKI